MADPLAETLVAARKAAGLSQAALARAMGISRITVHEAELGRDPRAKTLARYRQAFPGLRPEELIGEGEDRVPPSLASAWELQRDVFGACADVVTRSVTVRADGKLERVLTASGLRCVRASLADPAARAHVVRMALRGSSVVLAGRFLASDADLLGKPIVIEDGEYTHELTFPRSLDRRGLTYVRRESAGVMPLEILDLPADTAACLALRSCVAVEHPMKVLQLALQLPDRTGLRRPVLMAWPGPLVPEAGEQDLMDRLHPGGVGVTLQRERHRLVATVTRPLVGLCYALGWAASSAGALSRQARLPATLGEVLRVGREREGLSVRKLASRMGVSPTTVLQVEDGRDPRRSTLQAFLRALPDVSPWDALCAGNDAPIRPDEAWHYWRDIFGCEVAEDRKVVRLNASGDASVEIRTTDLVRSRPTVGDFRLRIGYSPPVMRRPRASLRGVDVGSGRSVTTVRIAPIVGVDGERLHQLIIPPALASSGVTFTRRLEHPGLYVMSARKGRERTGDPGPFHEGASFAATLPTRRLRLVVKFPQACRPNNPRVHAWPLTQVPDPEAPDALARLHPEGLRVDVRSDGNTLSVTVERPLVYVKYALSWRLPE